MNFLKTTLFSALMLSVTCASVAWAAGDDHKRFRRIVQTIEFEPQTPLNPLDAGHARAIELQLYTQAQADALDAAAIAKFNTKFGLDFSASNPNVIVLASGVRLLNLASVGGGTATFLPYILGITDATATPPNRLYIPITQDTKYPKRADSDWYNLQVGVLVIFSATPATFPIPGGINVGGIFHNQDVLFDGDSNFLKDNACKQWETHAYSDREIVKTTSYQTGLRTPDQWNVLSFAQLLNVSDKKGKNGWLDSVTVYPRIPEAVGPTYIQTVDTFYWTKPSFDPSV